MDCAAHNGHAKLIKLLIDYDAPINSKDQSLASVCVISCKYIVYVAEIILHTSPLYYYCRRHPSLCLAERVTSVV